MTTTERNRLKFGHYLKVKHMEAQVYGAAKVPQHIKEALEKEIAKDVPDDYETVMAPFRAELNALSQGVYD